MLAHNEPKETTPQERENDSVVNNIFRKEIVMGKTKRPVGDIIKEKIDWLEKQVREKNNDRLIQFPNDRDVANKQFGNAIDRLHYVRDYLLTHNPLEQSDPPVKDQGNE